MAEDMGDLSGSRERRQLAGSALSGVDPGRIRIEDQLWRRRIQKAVAAALTEHGPIDPTKASAEAKDIAERAIVHFALIINNDA